MSTSAILPPEIVLLVFQHVDNFHDATRLALVSREFLNLWQKERGKILYHIGLKALPAFDHAVLTVRATTIVRQAHEQKVVPPTISIPVLAETAIASLEELQDIFKLDLLGKTVEHIILQHPWPVKLELPCSPAWHSDVRASLYKVLLMNATLARPYQQPFWSLSKADRVAFAIFNDMTEEGHESHEQAPYMRFLLDSDAYEFENREKQQKVFSSFAEWFHEDCVQKYDKEGSGWGSSIDGDCVPYMIDGHNPMTSRVTREGDNSMQHGCLGCHVFRKLQQLLVMYGLLAGDYLSQVYITLYSFPQHPDDIVEPGDVIRKQFCFEDTEILAIVPVGEYKVYNVSIPRDIKAAAEAAYQPQLTNLSDDCLPNLAHICDWAYNYSGQFNRRLRPDGGGMNTTLPPLLVFEYMLRKFFGKRFDNVFDVDRFSLGWGSYFESGVCLFGSSDMDQPYQLSTMMTVDSADGEEQMYFYNRH